MPAHASPHFKFCYRFKLLGIPVIPLAICMVVCVNQLVSYSKTFVGYAGIFDKAELRHVIGNFVFSLGEERQTIAYSYLTKELVFLFCN